MIGTCTLARLDPGNLRTELGFALNRRDWGAGFMGEAVGVVLDFAFGPLGMRRVEADADPRNQASIRLLERLGFTREGFLRERWFVEGLEPDHSRRFDTFPTRFHAPSCLS